MIKEEIQQLFELGKNAFKEKKYKEAIKILDNVIEFYYINLVFYSDNEYVIYNYDIDDDIHNILLYTYYYLGISKYHLRKYKKSIEYFDKTLELDNDFKDSYYSRGLSYIKKHNYENAIKDFNTYLKYDDIDYYVYLYRGYSKFQLSLYEEAINDFNIALEKLYYETKVYYYRALSYIELNLYQNAIDDYTKIIEISMDHKGIDYKILEYHFEILAYNNNIYYERAEVYYKIAEYKKAIHDYDKASEYTRLNDMAIYHRGISKQRLSLYEEAINDFNLSISLSIYETFFYHSIIHCYLELNDYDKVIDNIHLLENYIEDNIDFDDAEIDENYIKDTELFKEHLSYISKKIEEENSSLKIKTMLYYYRGILNILSNNYKEAIENYTIALNNGKYYNINIYSYRALAYYNLGLYKNTIDDYNRIIELDNNFNNVYYYIAEVYYKIRDYEKAINNYNIAINFQVISVIEETIIHHRAISKEELYLYKEAIEDFNLLISLDYENIDIYYNLSYCNLVLKNYDEAIDNINLLINNLIELKIELNVNNKDEIKLYEKYILKIDEKLINISSDIKMKSMLYYYRGVLNTIAERYEESIEDYNKAIDLDTNHYYYYMRGISKSLINLFQDAILDYDKALELNNDYYEAYNRRAASKMMINMYEEAINDFDIYIKLNKTNISAFNNKAECYMKLQKYDEALKLFYDALKMDYEIPNIYAGIGEVKSKLALIEKENNNISNYYKLNREALEYFNNFFEIAFREYDEYNEDEMNYILYRIKKLAYDNIEPAIEFCKDHDINYNT